MGPTCVGVSHAIGPRVVVGSILPGTEPLAQKSAVGCCEAVYPKLPERPRLVRGTVALRYEGLRSSLRPPEANLVRQRCQNATVPEGDISTAPQQANRSEGKICA